MKLKKRVNKDLIALFILIPLFFAGAFFISERFGSRFPDYSVNNKGASGFSVFFDVLKELDYPVYRTLEPVIAHESECIQMVAQTGGFDMEDHEIQSWIENGGILIYFADSNFRKAYGDSMEDAFGTEAEAYGALKIYRVGSGTAVVADASGFTNKTMNNDTGDAYELVKLLTGFSPDKIYFNEAAMYTNKAKQTLWSYIPLELKFILVQLLLTLGLILYRKGKRFGKPIPLYEEVERSENEYLYSVASLYSQAKCWDLVLINYYKSFLRELKYPHDEWLNRWEQEYPDSVKKAMKVYEFMNKPLNNHSVKEYLQIVTILEHLKMIIRKRREISWKTMKKTL